MSIETYIGTVPLTYALYVLFACKSNDQLASVIFAEYLSELEFTNFPEAKVNSHLR